MAFLERCDDKKVLSGQLVVTGLWAAITAFGIYLSPSPHGHGTHQQLGLPPCPSVLMFDRPCPGCGLTTSWTATIHGLWPDAFRAHPMGPILYAGFSFLALLSLWGYFKRIRVDTSGRSWTRGMVVGAILFFGFGLTRFALMDNYSSPNEVQNFLQKLAQNEKPQKPASPVPQ